MQKPRWWPAIAILILGVVGIIMVWVSDFSSRQDRVLLSLFIPIFCAMLLVPWLLFFSRFPWKTRFKGLGVSVLIGFLAIALFDIREVSGDIIPHVAFRWSKKHYENLDTNAKGKHIEDVLTVTKDDFPQFLGHEGSNTIAHVSLNSDWENNAPKELWRQPIGAGWSGFAIVGETIFTQEQRGDQEMVTAYSLKDGSLLWQHGDAVHYQSRMAGDGPRSTPSFSNGKIYTFGSSALLNCLDAKTGKLLWQKDCAALASSRVPEWGYASSPLVTDDMVIVSPGGKDGHSLYAFDVNSGEVLWHAGNGTASYSSPQVYEIEGQKQIVVVNSKTVAAHAIADGKQLWEHEWGEGNPNCANPRWLPEHGLFVSSGYGNGCALFTFETKEEQIQIQKSYHSPRLKAKFANFVFRDHYVYGLDDGILTCVDITTGDRVWKKGRYGHGQLLMVGEHLLIQTESGSLLLGQANPDKWEELGSIEVLNGKSWNTMAFSKDKLLMRNHKEIVCLQLAVNTSKASL